MRLLSISHLIWSNLRLKAGSFASDTRGAIAVIFALSIFVLFGAVGGAVDFARWQHAKSQTQNAVDSAVLAGGRVLQTENNESQALTAASEYFYNMKSLTLSRGAPSFTLQESGTVVRGIVDGAIATSFLGVIGIFELPVYVQAEAVLATGGNSGTNIEISLMLDVTGSMRGQKIIDMKDAAKDLIDIVVWDDQSQYTSRVALAPFARRVNVGSFVTNVTNLPNSKRFGGQTLKPIQCVTERTGAEEFTDARPTGANSWNNASEGDRGNTARNNQSNYNDEGDCNDPSSDEAILPLSSNRTTIKSRIDSFSAGGTTAGALGTAWAWYMISPNWDTIWPSESRPAPYADLSRMGENGQPVLKKYAILMTDGIYNTYAGVQHGDGSSEAVTISDKAKQLCTNMKAAGIKVYTVGFQLGGSTLAIDTLKGCASREAGDPADDPSYFYNTSTGEELRQAFRDIALQIATLRIRS